MKNKSIIDFMVKFSELNEENQKYIMAIQQALAFAQSNPGEKVRVGNPKTSEQHKNCGK